MSTRVPSVDFVFQQGEDSEINLVYKYGKPAKRIDLTGYTIRMVLRSVGGLVLHTINDATFGTDGTIEILIPREVSLDGGELEGHIEEVLEFDLFLRNTDDRQRKILRGTIYFESSETLWT